MKEQTWVGVSLFCGSVSKPQPEIGGINVCDNRIPGGRMKLNFVVWQRDLGVCVCHALGDLVVGYSHWWDKSLMKSFLKHLRRQNSFK